MYVMSCVHIRFLIPRDGKVGLLDVAKRKVLKEFLLRGSERPVCLASNHSDSFVAAGCKSGATHLINMTTNKVCASPLKHSADQNVALEVTAVRYSAHRTSSLAVSSMSGSVTFWDVNHGSALRRFCEHAAPCAGIAFSPINGNLALSVGLDKKCVFYDVQTKTAVRELIRADAPLTAVEPFPDGKTLALGTSQGKVLFYDLRNFSRPMFTLKEQFGGAGGIKSLLCQPIAAGGSVTSSLRPTVRSKSKLTLPPPAASTGTAK